MEVKKTYEALKINSTPKSLENICEQCDNKTGSLEEHCLLYLG